MKKLVIITGPTAVGKTSISIDLAKRIGGEIISADSMQVYKGMDIGTAKIKEDEKEGVPHFLIDEFEPNFPFNVTIFKERVTFYMNKIWERGHIPILVGGTGFYIQAVLYDIDFSETNGEDEIRKELEDLLIEKGKDWLHEELTKVDPDYAATVSKNNTKKVIRAISFYRSTGKRLSIHNKKEREKASPYQFSYFVLTMDREKLYEKIEQRVDLMFEEGLIKEVRALYQKGYQENLVSMQGIGYKEIFPYLKGEITFEEARKLIKLNTRHFAKRQLTWFRREKNVTYVEKDKLSTDVECLDFILSELKKKEIIEVTEEKT